MPRKIYKTVLKNVSTPLVISIALIQPTHAHDFSVSAGGHYFTGDYGYSVDTDIYYAPITLKYDHYPWTVKLTVPYLSIQGPGTLIDGNIVVIEGSSEQNTEEGLGDVTSSVSYNFGALTSAQIWIDLTANIKWPTGDESRGLGTGTYDLGLEVNAVKAWESYAFFATLGYKFRERSPEYEFINSAYFSLGAQRAFDGGLSLGLLYDYYDASTKDGDRSADVLAYANLQVSPKWSVMLYGMTGVTESAADFGTGFSLTYEFK